LARACLIDLMTDTHLPEIAWPTRLPALHRRHLRAVVRHFASNQDLCGLAAGGSFITGAMDDYSDLDLVVVVQPSAWPDILSRRERLVTDVDAPPV
jgi:UTP:GlnB (protein PII) uridylyltransferase